ncbi:MAG TPA: hypothetical protein VG942_15500 [Hyphomonadaceae bacterium]|nr:hypothetical protein [Hyphomonadaceae bacterium]
MTRRLAILACMLVWSAAPAFGQTLLTSFSWPQMRQTLGDLGATVIADGADGEVRYLDVKSKDGLVFTVFGFECDTKETSQHCAAAELAASFTPKDKDSLDKALDALDYYAVSDNASGRGNVRMTRYVLFGGGISPDNLKTNLNVFLSVSQDAWVKLEDKGLLK